MPPDARSIVREQMDRNRRRVGDGLDEMNVVGRREQRVELTGPQRPAL